MADHSSFEMDILSSRMEVTKGLKDRQKMFCDLTKLKRERLSCSICGDILLDPRQSHCGCRFCYSCLDLKYKGSDPCRCPSCDEVMNDPNNLMSPDRAVEREISELAVICVNEGCEYKCRLKDLACHLNGCEYRNERCDACGKEYVHKDLKGHQRRECVMKRVGCVDCGMSMTKEDFRSKHRNVNGTIDELCDNWRGVCPYKCCGERQNSIKVHLKECRRMPIGCDMKRFGCSKVLPREEMEVHVNTETMYHMILMSQAIDDLRREKDEEVSRSVEAVNNLNMENYALSLTVSRIVLEVSTLKTKVETYERNLGSQGGTPVYSSPPSSWAENKFGIKKFQFESVGRKLEEVGRCHSAVISTIAVDLGIPGFRFSFVLSSNDQCLKLTVSSERTDLDGPRIDFNKNISIKWENDDSSENGCCYLLSSEGFEPIGDGELTMPILKFITLDKVNLEFQVEVTDVPVAECGPSSVLLWICFLIILLMF